MVTPGSDHLLPCAGERKQIEEREKEKDTKDLPNAEQQEEE